MFDAPKLKLLNAPVLSVFDPAARSEVLCDASNISVRSVLILQNTLDSLWLPVEYLSKYCNSAECKYFSIESESVGLILALHMWHHYLLGRPVTIRTDHTNL